MDKDLEGLMHSPQTQKITLKVTDNTKRATIPATTRELLNIQINDYIHLEYILPENNKTTYEGIYDYQQIDSSNRISVNPFVKSVLKLKDGDYFNVKISKVYFNKKLH